MYQDSIEISAYNSDTEQYRLVRIERVVGYLCAISEHYSNDKLLSKIVQLHDHKGMLTVTWRSEPSAGEKEFISKAWLSCIGDGADNVEHKRI